MNIRVHTNTWPLHQRTWWDLPNFIKILVGGYGCGKTYIGSLRAIYLSYLNTGTLGMLVSPTYPIAELTIIPTIKDILFRMEQPYTYNQTKHLFSIPNWDGHIKIGSGDDPISLKGGNMAWCGVDEPFVQKKVVFEEVMRRIRHPLAKHKELFMTGTPEELNWGYDICMNTEGLYDVGFVYGRTKDNTYLSEEYYSMLWNAYSDEQRQAYLEGKFLNLMQGRAYKEFDRDKHVKHADVNQSLTVCAGIDFNVDYMSAEVFYNGNGWVHFFDEVRIANSNTYELAEKLRAKYPTITVYPDPTGSARKSSATKSDHQILRDSGFTVRGRERVPLMDRLNAVNGMIRRGLFSVEPGTCPKLVTDLERVVFKNGDLDKQSDPALTHASDAAGYAIEYLYPVIRREAGVVRR